MQTVLESEVSPVSDVDGLFRIRAWVHYVSANPLNDDQLLLANDVAALLEQLEEARVISKLANEVSVWMHTSGIGLPSQIDEDSFVLGTKARAFLAKYSRGNK